MIPKSNLTEVRVKNQPTLTYKIHPEQKIIQGKIDGKEAVEQAIYKIISTERFQYEIYSWNYGTELRELIGQPKEYLYPELKRRLKEALYQDERITGVKDFHFEMVGQEATLKFTVETIYGDIIAEKVVRT